MLTAIPFNDPIDGSSCAWAPDAPNMPKATRITANIMNRKRFFPVKEIMFFVCIFSSKLQ
jgi:hypothetical protein